MNAAVASKIELVRHAFQSGRPAQAYLLTGELRGPVQEVALAIARLPFCTGTEPPCGTCEACRHIASRLHPDVHWFQPEMKSRVFSVKQMREGVLPMMVRSSMLGGWKVAILAGADRMNREAANAFLKTLEEPPARTLFVLLSDSPQELLPTVVSRCQRLDLPVAQGLGEPWLSRVAGILGADSWKYAATRAAGARALTGVLLELKDEAQRVVLAEEKALAGELVEDAAVVDARISALYRERRGEFLLTLQRWFRDLLLLVSGGDEGLLFFSGFRGVLVERAGRLSLAQALANIERIERMAGQLEANMAEEQVFLYWFDRLAHGV